jgi:hypothetical protein
MNKACLGATASAALFSIDNKQAPDGIEVISDCCPVRRRPVEKKREFGMQIAEPESFFGGFVESWAAIEQKSHLSWFFL